MIYSFRPLPLMKGCGWMTYHLTVHTIIVAMCKKTSKLSTMYLTPYHILSYGYDRVSKSVYKCISAYSVCVCCCPGECSKMHVCIYVYSSTNNKCLCDLRSVFSFFLSFFLSFCQFCCCCWFMCLNCTRQSWSFGSSIPHERLVSTSVLRRKWQGRRNRSFLVNA